MQSLSRLPSREVLYGQLVGVVASPVNGLVRTLGALLGGLAVALGQVREKKESGETPAGAPALAQTPARQPAGEDIAGEDISSAEEAPGEGAPQPEQPAGEATSEQEAEPEKDEPAQEDDKQADVSAEAQPEDAEANSTKED